MTENYSFGEKLRFARERKGLSPEEAAKALCLNVEIIHALEKEQFDKLPSPVFVRGYIKNYAHLLRLTINDASPVNASTPELSSPLTLTSSIPSKMIETGLLFKNIFLRVVNYVIVIMLAVMVFIWWHERNHALDKTDTTGSILTMTTQEIPFARELPSQHLYPIQTPKNLMQIISPRWPL